MNYIKEVEDSNITASLRALKVKEVNVFKNTYYIFDKSAFLSGATELTNGVYTVMSMKGAKVILGTDEPDMEPPRAAQCDELMQWVGDGEAFEPSGHSSYDALKTGVALDQKYTALAEKLHMTIGYAFPKKKAIIFEGRGLKLFAMGLMV